MPHYQPGFDGQDFERLKDAIGGLAESGPFDANDALVPLIQAGITENAGDVATILGDLADPRLPPATRRRPAPL